MYRVISQHVRSTSVADEHGRPWTFDATGGANVDVHAALYFDRLSRLGYTVSPKPPAPEEVEPFTPPTPAELAAARGGPAPVLLELSDVVLPVGKETRAHRFPLTVFDPPGLANAIKGEFSAKEVVDVIGLLGGVVQDKGRRPSPEQLVERVLEEFTEREVADIIVRLGGLTPAPATGVNPPDALDEAPTAPAPPPVPEPTADKNTKGKPKGHKE